MAIGIWVPESVVGDLATPFRRFDIRNKPKRVLYAVRVLVMFVSV